MDSKQTPQQRIEQDGKVVFKPDADHPLTAEHVGWIATLRDGRIVGPIKANDDDWYPFVADGIMWTPFGTYWKDGTPEPRDIDFVSPPEVPSQSELAQASEEAKEEIAEIAERYKEDKSELHQLSEGITKLIGGWVGDITSREYLYKHLDEMLANAFASRDEELRRLREENERLKKYNGRAMPRKDFGPDARFFVWAWNGNDVLCFDGDEPVVDRDGNTQTLATVTEQRDSNEWIELVPKDQLAAANEQVEKLRDELAHCEQLCGEACRALAQFRPQLSQQIIVRCKRAASGHITAPLTHSEAEKICAGEPVRQGEDLAAQVEKLQAENKLLMEQQKLAYNWLPRRDKEMFDQKYPKEVTV